MSSIADTLALADYSPQMEKITRFSPDALKAPFFLRCAALFIDYMILLLVPVIWLLWATFFGDGPQSVSLSVTTWLLVIIVWLINFIALPLFRGQTLGKMLAGITILKTDGTPARLGSIILRNIVGYFLTAVTLGVGFLIAAVNNSGRALHDYVGGTIVVHARKRLS